ncbi:lysozyme inhibitor LprI family protein [Acinetobacter sp.]|uniref:lysozyme inhibitor LprI family protein n=1 Tax=Acinetobacter sp. TaxID=472 RepID=UPI002585F5FF|nr:lysozyme inhibitor LprI family protein [Acinetobacter sp.]
MKNLILTTFLLSSGALANCNDPKTSFESQKCLSDEVKKLKFQLNKTYAFAYKNTEAKKELDLSQKKWLDFKDTQCGTFVVADTQGSPATVEYDLSCQTIIIQQRIDFLKDFLIH